MNFKKFFIPALAMSFALASCNKGGGKSTPDWDKETRDFMNDCFGVYIPYIDGLNGIDYDYTDDSFFVEGHIATWDDALNLIGDYTSKLANYGFEGGFHEIHYTEAVDGYDYDAIYGDYSHSTEKSFTVLEEEFAERLDLEIEISDDYTGAYFFMMSASLTIQYKDITEGLGQLLGKISNVVGEGVGFILPNGLDQANFWYRYVPGDEDDECEVYIDVCLENVAYEEEFFYSDLRNANFYMQANGYYFDYWCLPWDESYQMIIYGIASMSETYYRYNLTYGSYQQATIYPTTFPRQAIGQKLGLQEEEYTYIPAFSSKEGWGYKIWMDEGYVCVDAVDPGGTDSLEVTFLATLTEAGFAAHEDPDTETTYYTKNVEGVGVFYVEFSENYNYFTVVYNFYRIG